MREGCVLSAPYLVAYSQAMRLMKEVRADRVATLYFFRPLKRILRRPSAGIPILMYHRISGDRELGRKAYYRTCTDPTVFGEQMAFLARNGYETIGLGEAVRRLDGTTTRESSWF